MVGIDAVAWKTFDYPSMRVPAAGGGLVATAWPALWVRTRPHDHTPWATGTVEVYAFGVIGSGAFVTAVPMWMLDKLGIAAGERTEASAYSASGQLRAYKTMIGTEISHGGRWQDLGTVNVIAPDTEWSRNPKSNYQYVEMYPRGGWRRGRRHGGAARRCRYTDPRVTFL